MQEGKILTVRVRFAPSPTGSLHIGGARTALFNWLFAKKNNGTFILRIDDTDIARTVKGALEEILDNLKWLGFEWDEGPYFQSQRLERYHEAAEELLKNDKAYRCFCTPEELEIQRKEAKAKGFDPKYNGRCRNLSAQEIIRLEKEGRKSAIRLKVPQDGTTSVDDIIRGKVTVENSTLDDFVILKSNGMPTYHLASVVDDHDFKISHIIRAEEHLSNTPKQILLFEAFGWAFPFFAHVPMILAPDRTKLSKRHGAISVSQFREEGYLPQAIVNYLALLGWSPAKAEGDEVFELKDLVSLFDLTEVNKTAAIYDVKKLAWLNGIYLRQLSLDELTELLMPYLIKAKLIERELDEATKNKVKKVASLLKERARTLKEMAEMADYFFTAKWDYDPKGVKRNFKGEVTAGLLEEAKRELASLSSFEASVIEEIYHRLAEEKGIKTAEIIHPTRLAITGKTGGPGLFEIMEVLGKNEVLSRMERAISYCRLISSTAEE